MQNNFNLETVDGRLEFSRYVASEGIVLLKNEENVLPIGSEKVAVFGVTQLTSQGSNDGTRLDRNSSVGLTEAMIKCGINIDTDLYEKYIQHINMQKSHTHGDWGSKHSGNELELSETQVAETKANGAQKAIIVIGRASGENSDIEVEKGDYLLNDAEQAMIKTVCSVFSDVILLLHIGCNIDLGFLDENNIKGILYLNQLGQNGSLGMADILTGKVSPSGKLTFSMAKHFEDYSSSEYYGQHHGGLLQDYVEDIYVGYRYFETFDGADENLVYPFGFGLSYTDFEISEIEYKNNGKIMVSALVTNIGKVAGKQVVQLYYSVPDIKDGAILSGPEKQLCGFEKTKLLKPCESQRITIEISPEDMASYDDLGVLGEKSCFVMEKGVYKLLLGTDSRNLVVAGEYEEKENRIIERCHSIPTTLSKRLNRKGEYDILPEPQLGKERYYAISSMEETVLKAVNCCDRDITDFAELKAGESVTYRLLPGSGGGYYVSFVGANGENVLNSVSLKVAGVDISLNDKMDENTVELKLPIGRTTLTVTAKKDGVPLESIIFNKVDAKTEILPDRENFVEAANIYESTISTKIFNLEDDGFGNSCSYLEGIPRPGRYAIYKLDVKEDGKYNIKFKYAYSESSRPINGVIALLVSNIVQPLGTTLLEQTYEKGENRVFKTTPDFVIELPKGIAYLKLAAEMVPFPDVCGFYISKNNDINAQNVNQDKEAEIDLAAVPSGLVLGRLEDSSKVERIGIQFEDVYKNPELMDAFLEQMTNRELAMIVSGTTQNRTPGGDVGCNHPVPARGVPAAQTADGPCGLRQNNQFPIAFPVPMVLCASFNKEVYRMYGESMGNECVHYEVDYLLGPSINIFRNPAGGRNCSYFSEDPYLAGITAAYYIKGVQSKGIATVLKHYAANSTEYERLKSNSRVSERALREIYIKGFRIAIKESDPFAIMSSYNHINDVKVAENYNLITEIPRDEWNWDGVFFTDWWNDSSHVAELKAGHDLKMSTGDVEGVTKALDEGILSREQVIICAKRIVKMLMKLGRIKKQFD